MARDRRGFRAGGRHRRRLLRGARPEAADAAALAAAARPRGRARSRVRFARPGSGEFGRVGRRARSRRRHGSPASAAGMPANVPEGGIWLSTRPADMRKSFDGLAALVRNELGGDVVSGGWFIFVNRKRTMMKIIGFGPGGCWIRAGGSSRVCSRFPSALAGRRRRSRGPISRPCWTGSTSPPSAAASATRVRAEAVEGPVRRRSAEVGPRNRSRMPRLRSAERNLKPEKSGQNATSQFSRLRYSVSTNGALYFGRTNE